MSDIASAFAKLGVAALAATVPGAAGAFIAIGGNLAVGAYDARRARKQMEDSKVQKYIQGWTPSADGLLVIDLPVLVERASDPGPGERMQALRAYFERPPSSPWERLILDECDGFPVIRGIGARVLAAYPQLAEPRAANSESWTVRCRGQCMAPWLDDGFEVTIDPAAKPEPGGIVAAYLALDDADPIGKWLLAPVPLAADWAQYPDAVAILGTAESPDRMFACPLVALDMLVGLQVPEPAAALEVA